MKRILSFVLIIAMILSANTVFARLDGEDNRSIYQPTDDPVYYYQPPVDENGEHDYFGYTMYDDPMDITDEEFFGEWDSVGNIWVTQPYFRYSEFPDLYKVENAVKSGNYAEAKEFLMEYYLSKPLAEMYKTSVSVPNEKTDATLQAMSRNIFPYTFISAHNIGMFELPADEWSKVEIDVRYEIVSAVESSYEEFNLMLASGDKYWTTGQVYSKDAEDKSLRPMLEMTVNGVTVQKEPVKDTMVVGGREANTNFGSNEIMEFQEHGVYDDINSAYNSYDENTKRSFITFDLSDININDTISSAKIILTGRNVITDETREKFADEDGTPYSGNANDKLMWALWYKTAVWEEDTLCWNSEVILDKMYFSCHDMHAWDYITPSDANTKGKVCDFHRDNQASRLRKAYQYYGDERYAYTYIRQEMALINAIGCEPKVMNSLDMSTHMSGMGQSFYTFIHSEYMTADICTAWLKFMWQLCNWQVENFYGTVDNNWATFATSAVYRGCAYFPEWITHDRWYEATVNENYRCLSGMTLDDGLCIEQSHNYISTVLSTFSTPMSVMLETGHEGPYNEELYEDIYDCVKSLVYTSGPYFGGFNIADGYDPYASYMTRFREWYEYLFSDDEELEWLISGGTSGSMPENATTRYPTSYRTYMRSGWDKNSLQMSFVNTTDSRASHEHNDALSVAMFAYGKYLLVDNGYGGDQTSDGGKVWLYNKSPVQHNLVTVNDTYDYLTDGVVAYTSLGRNSSGETDFESNNYFDYVEYFCNGYSTTQTQQRSVTFLKDKKFWIISDYAVPNDPSVENTFAQHWHLYPGANMTNNDNYVVRSNFNDINVMIVPLEYEEIDNVEYVDTYYAEVAGQKILNKKAMYTKTKNGNGRFTTLIIPLNIGEDYSVDTTKIVNYSGLDENLINASYFRIVDNTDGNESYYYYYHINDASLIPEDGVKIGRYTTDATTMLIQKNSKEETVFVMLVNGSYIKDSTIPSEYLFKSNEPATISYSRNGYFVDVVSSVYKTSEELKGMSVYMPAAKGAYLNDAEVGVDINDNIVTFNGTYDGNSNISSGSGSGGGGGGATVKPPVKDEDKTDEKDVTPVTPVDPTPVTPSYDDVAEDDWYFDYVEELTEKEIVSGDGTGSFAPNSNVTREQFLKMLIEAADVEAEEGENTFADVLDDAWYREYVLKAKNFGIVNGISETEFGIGANITRQDMAVMISRTIEKLGIEIEETEVEVFADAANVSEYAKDAVTFMKSIGLIEGYNNEFRPLDNLTRAEAAKVISELLKML